MPIRINNEKRTALVTVLEDPIHSCCPHVLGQSVAVTGVYDEEPTRLLVDRSREQRRWGGWGKIFLRTQWSSSS